MSDPPSTRPPIGLTVAAVVVLVASFLPWGEIRSAPQLEFGEFFPPFGMIRPGTSPFGENPFGEMEISINAWNGSITPAGLKLPNWLVVLAAGGVALVGWLSARGVWKPHVAVPIGLAGYGLAHSGFWFFVLARAETGSPGIGVIVTGLAFVGMLVVVLQHLQAAEARSGLKLSRAPADPGGA
jgi:hypothetical protein